MAPREADALDFMRSVQGFKSLDGLTERFLHLAQGYGFSRFTYTHLATPGLPLAPRILLSGGDAEPGRRYVASGAARVDPTVRHAFTTTRAFTWTDMEPHLTTPQARDLFAAARAGGTEGLVVPVHSAFGEVSAVVLVGQGAEINDGVRHTLQACASLFAVYGGDLHEAAQDGPTNSPLSRRETQCLAWLARGKTAPETASILGISLGTVKIHLENARAKLGHQGTIPTILEAARRRWLYDFDEE